MKTFIITGTRKGIGKALAERYLEMGCTVAGCSRGEASLEHANYRHHRLDITDERAVVKMVRATARKFGGIDVLLNNAGVAAMNHLTMTPAASARSTFDTNFMGTFLFLREAAKVMARRKTGRIVNFTTVAVPLHLEGEAIYAASKAAVESLTRIAAREFAPLGITVNAVGSTPVKTGLVRGVPSEKLEALIAQQAIKRWGTAEDIANVIDFFASETSDFVTGQVIYLGGVSD
jgi:3-oxoacyl-[acyl-carrier protein] reductase